MTITTSPNTRCSRCKRKRVITLEVQCNDLTEEKLQFLFPTELCQECREEFFKFMKRHPQSIFIPKQ